MNGHAQKRPRTAAESKEKRPKTASSTEAHANGGEKAESLFKWMLGVTRKEFFKTYFEKEHLVCSHGSANYFSKGKKGVMPPVDWSTSRMVELAGKKELHFGTDLNVVRFDTKLKKRVSYKTEGVVNAKELEDCMNSGWSVRFLRPHEFIECNSAFISFMESEFGCYCGVNSYWTPANSQGFAPHYDDVDVFLLQLEGEKEWRLYDPLEDVDHLTRHSSEDYLPEQFPRPKHSITLKAGDVLYMPRGMVHQGRTTPSTHSLHITFSSNQMNSWADLFLRAATHTIETLAANNLRWRRAIPRDMFDAIGAIHNSEFRAASELSPLNERSEKRRAELQHHFREMSAEVTLMLTDETNIDVCTDMYAKDTVSKLQPLSHAYHGTMSAEEEILPSTRVRLASKNCCHLMLHIPGEAHLVHTGDNSPVCLGGALADLPFEASFAPALATLISRYPKPIEVSALPFPEFDSAEDVSENQALLCETLRDAGLLCSAE